MRSRALERLIAALTLAGAAILAAETASMAQSRGGAPYCDTHEYVCAENHYNYLNSQRIGHDEPALLFYSSTQGSGDSAICVWQFGGAGIHGTTKTFGDANQYGNLLALNFPLNGIATTSFDVFRGTPQSNPCAVSSPSLTLPAKPISFGNVRVGKTSGIKALKIVNPTTVPIILFSLTLPSDYHLTTGKQTSCLANSVLAPGRQMSVWDHVDTLDDGTRRWRCDDFEQREHLDFDSEPGRHRQ